MYPNVELLHIGLDDTDSLRGGCTTHTAMLLVEKLKGLNCLFADYPNLVRLNPNIPWKTRGNGAIALRVLAHQDRIKEVYEAAVECVNANSDLEDQRTNPALVFLKGEVPDVAVEFAKEALWDLIPLAKARKVLNSIGADAVAWKKGRGIIGALAAVGEQLHDDHTFEVILYRTRESWDTKRNVDAANIIAMDKATTPLTWNNYDEETRRILVTPRGPDPILLGIRGETPSTLLRAVGMLTCLNQAEKGMFFRTNQGTDSHLTTLVSTHEILPYRAVILRGTVASAPRTLMGGHVFFRLRDSQGEVDCAVYEPTGSFRSVVRQLVEGDLIVVYGGVRKASTTHPRTVNVEKIDIQTLGEAVKFMNPRCPQCNRRLASMGVHQGLRCRRCGFRQKERAKEKIIMPRSITPGTYLPPPHAHRHLTKPRRRYGLEKQNPLRQRFSLKAEDFMFTMPLQLKVKDA